MRYRTRRQPEVDTVSSYETGADGAATPAAERRMPLSEVDLAQRLQPSTRRGGLTASARKRLQDTVPDETLTAYKREWQKCLDWCTVNGVVPIPMPTDDLTNWVAERCDAGDSVTAIKQGISAVKFFHDQHPDLPLKLIPERHDAWRIVNGHNRNLVAAGWRPDEAAAFNVEQLRLMCAAMPGGRGSSLRDKAILTLGTARYARRSVLARLMLGNPEDVLFTEAGDARVFVTKDKTRKLGAWKLVPRGEDPLSDPVGALRDWIDYLHAHGVREGPLFRHFKKTGTGEWLTDKPIAPKYVGTVVRRWAKAAELEAPSGRRFRAHSLRASGATIAFDARRPAVQIALDGDWAPKGNQVHLYNRSEGQDVAMRGLL